MSNLHVNRPAPGVEGYYPLNEPAIGTPLPKEKNPPKLFQPLTLRGTTFKNRIFVAPMCQYSSDDGHATDWHLVHLGGFATRGAGAICVEATAVVPEGRISPEDAGLWTDSQIPKLKQIVNFCHGQGTLVGIQLAHAGRKASTYAPWVQRQVGPTKQAASADENGWPTGVVGPTSELKYDDGYPSPVEASEAEMQRIEDAFVAAAARAKEVGFDFIEIHNAHGYLLHSFLSPISNTRSDAYGGQPLDNRMRFPLRIAKALRAAWDKPLFVRISASDWAPGEEKQGGEWKQWGIEQSTLFTKELVDLGIDLLDVSSGGNTPLQKIPIKHGYQVHFAAHIKAAFPDLAVGAVGLITEPKLAEQYLTEGDADVIFLARTLMQNPHWPLEAARALGASVKAANQYERSWPHTTLP